MEPEARPSTLPDAPDTADRPAIPPDVIALGVIRLGVGAALVAAPAFAGRVWVGEHAQGAGTRVFARAIGARDMVLGARIITEARSGERARELVTFGALADLADIAATLVAARHLTRTRRIAMPLIAAAVGGIGMFAVRRAVSATTDGAEAQGASGLVTPGDAAASDATASDATVAAAELIVVEGGMEHTSGSRP